MTVYELKRKHEEHFPESVFFDKETLKYWGNRLSEMKVDKETRMVTDSKDVIHECYVLYIKHHKIIQGTKLYYFDIHTYQQILDKYE